MVRISSHWQRKQFLCVLIIVLAGSLPHIVMNHSAHALKTSPPLVWKLVWDDEFNVRAGTVPDPNKWTPYVGGNGWGNNQLEYDTDNHNAYQNGKGQLVLEARKENPASYLCWYGACRYTSARLSTKFSGIFTYGKFIARIKLPSGQGVWPAFWLLGHNIMDGVKWPDCGEIDTMENIGREPATVHGTIHGPGYGPKGIGMLYTLSRGRFADAYHIFAVQWSSTSIRFFVDGKNYFTIGHTLVARYGSWVFDHSFYILLNLSIGGPWPGTPDATTQFPQKMLVDYVRVYQLKT